MRLVQSSSGFTLVELVVAMTISAILVGFVAMLIGAPVDAYIDQSERAQITQASEAISRSLSRDISEGVLPNSVRVSADGMTLEMLKVVAVSQYVPVGAYAAKTPPSRPETELAFATSGEVFDLFGQAGTSNDFLVIGHQGTSTRNAYEMERVIVAGFTVENQAVGVNRITLGGSDSFAAGVASQRAYWVREPVTYICNLNARTLRRFSGYTIAANIASSEGSAQLSNGRNALISDKVEFCSFSCGGSGAICEEWLRFEAALVRHASSGDETIRLLEQYAVDNRS